PVGWLNDPNGLSYYQGQYHFFFQYAPFSADGQALKFWGHATSTDLIHWQYHDVAIYPDSPQDIHGVYSGGTLTIDGQMELFFTGNVKLAGDYDFIHDGREGNTLRLVSEDGFHFGAKQCVIPATEYPKDYSCHIRDPKVWKDGSVYYMLLGARRRDDVGCVLLYSSSDKLNWKFEREIGSKQPFGYMWECPDRIELAGRVFLAMSPQGVGHQPHRLQNVYAAGYLPWTSEPLDEGSFTEWDFGFDFYAPQTFVDQKGRTILVGWAGLPDIPYTNPTVALGWQHCLTTPRELTLKNGRVCQWPVEEFESLRSQALELKNNSSVEVAGTAFDLELIQPQESFELSVNEAVSLQFADGLLTLSLSEAAGYGREKRYCEVETIRELRILADSSLLEIYVNGGEQVLTTRYYVPEQNRRLQLAGQAKAATVWSL
ncbi:MAG: glycoside hydrolase family 32 protein, partial [Lachnospiraceae bacterium]|nr:glycoside hydrolase family 32 protein [Lachnospiraceae bacterium]